jgi:hypothetical protein
MGFVVRVVAFLILFPSAAGLAYLAWLHNNPGFAILCLVAALGVATMFADACDKVDDADAWSNQK